MITQPDKDVRMVNADHDVEDRESSIDMCTDVDPNDLRNECLVKLPFERYMFLQW